MAEEEFLVWEDEEARLWVAEDGVVVWVAEEVVRVWVGDLESVPELLWTVAEDEDPPRDEEDELRVVVPEEFLCWVELL